MKKMVPEETSLMPHSNWASNAYGTREKRMNADTLAFWGEGHLQVYVKESPFSILESLDCNRYTNLSPPEPCKSSQFYSYLFFIIFEVCCIHHLLSKHCIIFSLPLVQGK